MGSVLNSLSGMINDALGIDQIWLMWTHNPNPRMFSRSFLKQGNYN